MDITVEHSIDAGDADQAGRYDYYYEMDTYVFTEGDEVLVARVYADQSHVASFIGLTSSEAEGSELATQAVAHLRTVGVREFKVYDDGYPGYGYLAWRSFGDDD